MSAIRAAGRFVGIASDWTDMARRPQRPEIATNSGDKSFSGRDTPVPRDTPEARKSLAQ